MTKKIFKSTMLVSVVVLAMGLAFVMGILYRHFDSQMTDELEKQAVYLSRAVELEGEEYLEALNEKESRITYISADGSVLFDNQAETSKMENHGEREEIREALETGEGEAERMSGTLSEKTVYYALRLSNGNILRVSSTQESVLALVLQLINPVIMILVVMVILTGVFASRVSKRIVEPINELDLEHPEENLIYEEVEPLLSKIHRQNRQIQLQLEIARRQQEEFAIITENMQEGLLVIDKYTRILSGNSSAWRLFQVAGPAYDQSAYSLDRSEEFRTTIKTALGGKHGSTQLKLNGETIQMIANPVAREEKTAGAVLLLLNVTEKAERETLRREFSTNVSHELKTPLTAISGFAEIIQSGLVKEEDVKTFAGKIYQETQHLIGLVEDTIRISRLDESGVPYEWEEVDMYDTVKEVCGRFEDIARKRDIQIQVKGEHVKCSTVKPILTDVLHNLCDNAVKYNKDGGKVTVDLKKNGNNIYITVKDNGIGISKDDQNRVFERFYRADKSHSRKIEGTGLGLSIVKHGMAYLEGEVKLFSEEGKGTEITLVFPEKAAEI